LFALWRLPWVPVGVARTAIHSLRGVLAANASPTPQRLRELDINIVEEQEGKGKDYSGIESGDVVIFPAFGATAQEMKQFRDQGVQIVDTTCPWVAKVSGREVGGSQRGGEGVG
jgi:4-hydroxy-3-methylbut-2-enyl diphosphate reductase IspH